jgi:Domain of unknown function (DUF4167)
MRQGQQNRRGRGRSSSSNRKGQSPLTRSFESTGPDVKIRGTPAHIAEKYMSLARDATSTGDPVLAENYLQHAEHYNRIIMAFRDQQIAQGGEMANGGMSRNQPVSQSGDQFDDDDQSDMQHPNAPMRANEPQPRIDNHRMDGQRGGGSERFRDRQERSGGGERGYRPQRQRSGGGGGNEAATSASANAEGGAAAQPSADAQPAARERFGQSNEQPEFLRRPVRRPRRESAAAAAGSEPNGGAVTEDADRD